MFIRLAKIYTFSQSNKFGNVTFLSPNKKVTKEVGIGEALRKGALPYVPYPPHRRPTRENVPIFAGLPGKKPIGFRAVSIQKSEHFWMLDGEAAQGFLKGTCLFVMSP